MSDDVISKLPEMLGEPVAIMDSKNNSSRLVVFGDLQGTNGKTVIAILEMNPNTKGITVDDIKLASAYGKDNLQNLINTSNVLWMDNKKRSNWMMRTRLQLPVGISTTSNYIVPSTQQKTSTTSSGEDIRNSIKVDWDTHNSYEVPARTYDDTVGFFGTDEEIESMEQQDLAVKSYYANIIHSKGFKGFMFEFKDGSRVKQNYLTRSTRKGYDWQYSYGYDNEPHGHNNYKDVNDIVEVYGNVWGDDMQALYQELLDATPADKISTSKRRIICRT